MKSLLRQKIIPADSSPKPCLHFDAVCPVSGLIWSLKGTACSHVTQASGHPGFPADVNLNGMGQVLIDNLVKAWKDPVLAEKICFWTTT